VVDKIRIGASMSIQFAATVSPKMDVAFRGGLKSFGGAKGRCECFLGGLKRSNWKKVRWIGSHPHLARVTDSSWALMSSVSNLLAEPQPKSVSAEGNIRWMPTFQRATS
jgi:hypothetical protein